MNEKLEIENTTTIEILVESFGYKHGKPVVGCDAHLILDCRVVANPGTARARKMRSGLNKDIARDVLKQPCAEWLVGQGIHFVLESLGLSANTAVDIEISAGGENDGCADTLICPSNITNTPCLRASRTIDRCERISSSASTRIRRIVLSYGCHAGLHRSVAIAEAAVGRLRNGNTHRLPGVDLRIVHHSLSKSDQTHRSKKDERRARQRRKEMNM